MKSKLNLDFNIVDEARNHARNIAKDVQGFIDKNTTVTVERTICRLLSIDGVNEVGVPLPNVVVDNIKEGNGLSIGAAYYIGNAMLETGLSPQRISEEVSKGTINLTSIKERDEFEVRLALQPIINETLDNIKTQRKRREDFLSEFGDKEGPLIYVIVATGNIYEDITQAVAAAKQGADVIAVIRTTGQSLLDYVPYGATTEGFGGTFATQENFKLMRKALDDIGVELHRYIRLCNYCSGLCMPEIAAMGALEGLDIMLNDALYGILFRDINMKRTIIDQFFSRVINGFAGVIINTGEDNYLTTADAIEEAHTVLASQLMNEQFALLAGLPEKQQGLGHAFEIDPEVKNGFLFELAQAEMAREIFPNAPLKYMPPTKFMTGNIFRGHVQDTLFNIVTVLTNQRIHLLGMLTEAIHTPFMSDRFLSIENAKYIQNTMADLSDEIVFKPDGIMANRADEVLKKACRLLEEIEHAGLFETLERGTFAGIKRPINGGKGLIGVVEKADKYFNPFIELMLGGEK
ncbi:beta-lysine 5,6-aminomutase alpha subunit /D-lysine 5,6-aminomutase alpha subunit [Clostridium cadaveris]|uniref:Beta-lysine 5,6-aminomutase alpha subunit /D-lysine 5,6-aminomutase alpha subunit n=1 Tax=Clostridium cadaveris TaxID=1529 RepID=A0A1I2M9H8_9CLOT|nr:lysine 5,6-aminomutase subunit alpha [Clostridium cadaveris]MDM8311480.1 lysine 5,6-aminomutase subunit alpha [Clostridium cadaveris]NME65561.1 D-lysine 5,6-aminomutase subunit alpha [Clostridium cadaveris]SFF86157.1 beta-lysine 5,6-aminomutase alpha subunit /D-lysine 5,6-aminomutase alpha subunit [Clostridium cadaveris]